MTQRLFIALLAVCAVSVALAQGRVTNQRVLEEARQGENWFLKGGSFGGEHYSPLDQVNTENVDELGLAWAADLPSPDGISTTPIVVDGVIYLSGGFAVVFAVDASNGEILWTFDPKVQDAFDEHYRISWLARVNRGVAVWDGNVYSTAADCRLHALDAKTGALIWERTVCDIEQGYAISDSPYVGGGMVFVGNAGSESEENNRGHITAYDAKTGEQVWRFYIVPSHIPEENDTPALRMAAETWSGDTLERVGGGGNNWNEMTYDPVSDQLFFGTSGSADYIYEDRSPGGGDNLFLSSIVAVNASTGEYNWHYQTVDRDSWDYNATMNIVLADLRIDDADRETVLIAPKNGFHYALDRHTGELLTAGKYAKVNWATHINMETGRPVYDPAGAFWEIPDGETTIVWPNMWGAHNWTPMAYHPETKLSYIPVIDVPGIVDNEGGGEDLVMLTEVDGEAHAPGKLVAFDPAAGEIRWSVDYELPFNSGLLTTAGNLVFQGTADGHFIAYSADDGERLWQVQTGSAINAGPASYSIDGTQYILAPIGAGGALQFIYPQMHSSQHADGPTRLMAFSLDGRSAMPADNMPAPVLPPQPALEADAETIAFGEAIYAEACQFCHGSNGQARHGGSIPDLRYADAATHETWHGIVIGGSKRAGGMPMMELSVEQSEAVRSYVLSLSEALRTAQ